MYTTRDKVEQYLKADLSAIASEVNNWIASVKAVIDNYCGKSFESGSSSSDRYYDGDATDQLLVDAFTGTPTVSILNTDGTVAFTLSSSDFLVYPLNATQKDRIVLTPTGRLGRFSRAYFDNILDDDEVQQDSYAVRKLVKVTAVWGGATGVPADVELAATKLVANIASQRVDGGNVKSESLGDYSVSFGDDPEDDPLGVKALLAPYVDIAL